MILFAALLSAAGISLLAMRVAKHARVAMVTAPARPRVWPRR